MTSDEMRNGDVVTAVQQTCVGVVRATAPTRVMPRVWPPAAVGSAMVLSVLAATTGLGVVGWSAGLLCAGVMAVLLRRSATRRGVTALGPADWVTTVRAALGCGLAALVADRVTGGPTSVIVGVAAVALTLDTVDGRVARRTGTVSAFGAAFDMEVDAFVLLVLSIAVVPAAGGWVLLIGAARYLLLLATRRWPWLAAPVPVRYWAKVVAAVQGVALVVVLSGVLPAPAGDLLLVAALLLLAESFAHQVRWLTRHRGDAASSRPVPAELSVEVAR